MDENMGEINIGKLPRDCSAREVSTRARSIVTYKLDAEKWEWHEQTGTDHGTDMVIELVENENFTNKKIEVQIKGRTSISVLKNGDISFGLDVKTVNYALSSSNAFVLFLVDVTSENVYYLPIQDYFIANPDKFDAVENNKTSVNVHISKDNVLNNEAYELCEIAKSVYINGSSRLLKKL
jgi:hypothetical protein